jgi:hypothetical protein
LPDRAKTRSGADLIPELGDGEICYERVSKSLYIGTPEGNVNIIGSSGAGIKGDTGAQGLPGQQGVQGERGLQGIPGADGLPGSDGASGAKGDKGDPGTQGIQGLKGDTGNDGATGADGAQGAKGDPGNDGAQGIQGIQGAKGDTGNQGIQGVKGDAGAQGIQGIQGERGLTGDVSGAWPVGSVFFSAVSTSPATLLGLGTWSQIGQGKFIVGLDSGDTDFDTAEETGGAKTVTLTEAQMPQHTHVQNAHAHNISHVRSATTGAASTQIARTADTSSTVGSDVGTDSATAVNQNAGSGQAHNNLPPYLVLYIWKRTA